ncbi:HAD family hydrolase [Phenylobacterium sp.]|uniref:HAD family hydrolase n=1 Tax=Phenylobacterium sp. TaxID=1871053 RepID=UPI0035AE192E
MVLPRPVRAVVFDMDGLLVDTEAVYRDAMTEVMGQMGHPMSMDVFRAMIGLPDNAHLLTGHYGDDFPVQAFNSRVLDLAEQMIEAGVALKPGAVELLDHLDDLKLPRAIATSSSRRAVDSHLRASGVIPRFHAIVAKGDYARGKPAPDPYLLAAERLGVDPVLCLALEDSHNGVRSASSAGMMTVMVPDLLAATEEMHGLCVRVAGDLHEVRTLLEDA